MFNPFSFLRKNKQTSFKIGVRVSVLVTHSISGQHIKYIAYSRGFELVFEYIDYFHATIDIPTQALADFLSIQDFNGRLTEEQYSVFAMYSI